MESVAGAQDLALESRRGAVRRSIRNTAVVNATLLLLTCVPVLSRMSAGADVVVAGCVAAHLGAGLVLYRRAAAVPAGPRVERCARAFAAVSVAATGLVIATVALWAISAASLLH